MKSRSYGELGLGAKAQVRPRSWVENLVESWTSVDGSLSEKTFSQPRNQFSLTADAENVSGILF